MIENMLDIAAPAEKVFDFVVDVRNEPMESSYAACGDAPQSRSERVPRFASGSVAAWGTG